MQVWCFVKKDRQQSSSFVKETQLLVEKTYALSRKGLTQLFDLISIMRSLGQAKQ